MKNKPAPQNAFYAQSGGVSAVINASACGVIETARKHKDRIGKLYAGRHGIAHAPHAIGDQLRSQHETGAERSTLHPIARAAHVEVDFGEARRRADARGGREFLRIAAPQLQRHRRRRS